MKKLLCATLAVMLMLLSVAPAFAASIRGINPGDTLYVATSGGKLNLRAKPSAKAARVTKLDYGTAVIAGSDYEAPFLKVTVSSTGVSGWVDINYLSVTKPSKKQSSGSTETPVLVSELSFRNFKKPSSDLMLVTPKPSRVGGSVNLRWIPSTQASILRKMYANEELTVITEGAKWYQVQTSDGYVGFVMKQFTSLVYQGKADGYSAK